MILVACRIAPSVMTLSDFEGHFICIKSYRLCLLVLQHLSIRVADGKAINSFTNCRDLWSE